MHAWEQIQSTVAYIEDHISEEIAIEALAEMAALSPFYYQRLFRRLVRKPVAEYIRLRRMAMATEALLHRDRRILDVAIELGYSSHEQFTRTFRDTFGMTPEEYRTHPRALNRMTKPELALQYTLVDEGVPLIAGDIVLEVNRQRLEKPLRFAGLEKRMPASYLEGLGTESGVDPLDALWREFHTRKASEMGLPEGAEEIGVTHPADDADHFLYFAGGEAGDAQMSRAYAEWTLEAGEYVVCAFEAESFSALVMDALYKAQQYLYSMWLPKHGLVTEPFCAERYASHAPETTEMALWLKIAR